MVGRLLGLRGAWISPCVAMEPAPALHRAEGPVRKELPAQPGSVVRGDAATLTSWSSDGKALAVVRAEDDRPTVRTLWLVDLASGDLRRLTDRRAGQPSGGSWFPDGERLAYSHEDSLGVLDVKSGRERI